MARANCFRKNAETCIAAATQAENPEERLSWLVRAQRWLELAGEAGDKDDNEPLQPGAPRWPPIGRTDQRPTSSADDTHAS